MLTVRRRRRGVLTLVLCLVAALGGVVTGTATADAPPAAITITGITSDTAVPPGLPDGAKPYVLVTTGQAFVVSVSVKKANGQPATFKTDVPLELSASAGTQPPSTGVLPAGRSTTTLTGTVDVAANRVSLTVKAAGPSAVGVMPGTSTPTQLFDVLSALRSATSTQNFAQGIGGDGSCTSATEANPVCGTVVLPRGAVPLADGSASQVLLSLGACAGTTDPYARCNARGAVVQTLANLTGLYPKNDPATVIMKCDKTLCGTGAIQSTVLNYSLLGDSSLTRAEACPRKNTIGGKQDACVDYVQSKRDGSGDTHLYLLLTRDARVSVG